MEVPLLLLLGCYLVLAKYTNTITNDEEKVASPNLHDDLTYTNGTNITSVYYVSSVQNEMNISSADDIIKASEKNHEATSMHVDANEPNITSAHFSNDQREKDSNISTSDNLYQDSVNSTIFSKSNINISSEEDNRGLPEEIVPSFDSDTYKKDIKGNVHSHDQANLEESGEDSFEENKRGDVAAKREEVKMSGRERHIIQDAFHKDGKFGDDNADQDEEYGDDYELDEDVDLKDNEEYGIRDSLDNLIRKTITGRDSILRRIFSRRRFFRRIIDK